MCRTRVQSSDTTTLRHHFGRGGSSGSGTAAKDSVVCILMWLTFVGSYTMSCKRSPHIQHLHGDAMERGRPPSMEGSIIYVTYSVYTQHVELYLQAAMTNGCMQLRQNPGISPYLMVTRLQAGV